MTLAELIPSLRTSLPAHLSGQVWPSMAHRDDHGEISVGEVHLGELAEEFGTPTYVLDEADVRQRCREYATAFGPGNVVYAAKALTCRGVLRWIAEEGLSLGVHSAGQLATAAAVGFPADRIVLQGDAKSPTDLAAALKYGVGTIVIESSSEIPRLAALLTRRQRVLLRVLPDWDTGRVDTMSMLPAAPVTDRFGVPAAGTSLDEMVRRIIDQPMLELVGLDFFLGSQTSRFGGYERAISHLVATMAALAQRHGTQLSEINIGGGHAVPGTDADGQFALDAFASRARKVLRVACDEHNLPVPRLGVAPGRAIVARAGVALYRVLAVRRDPDGHQLVAVDGGLSDNPRPALYGARYTAVLLGRLSRAQEQRTTVVGRHDESGDVLVQDAPLPGDLRAGDLLAIPCSGAYQISLASNYNLVPRPPLVAVHAGRAQVLVRGETVEDVLARDLDPAAPAAGTTAHATGC
ncbi:diaminopimelate decarboxylase [Micromonospora sp. NPDC050417]|uniref:diaminopimelate decarboxylase n=1 Tax=Micromonospora sp. NPDC050417 TaxID=3364280 RepID=UPI003792DBB9